jgi:hypothetical protein
VSEEKLEVFNVLNFLDNGYELEDILNEGNFGTFSSVEDCINYLVDGGYIEDEFDVGGNNGAVTAEEISKKYKVSELKDILREHGLKVSGNKKELVERVLPVLDGSEKSSQTELIEKTDKSYDLKLTQKAKDFIKENEWIDLYMFALVQFSFTDYETFVAGSGAGIIETAHNFCDEIISRALMANQFLVFRLALSAKAHVFAYARDYESFLDYDLQHFILGLNPIMLSPKDYVNYEIVNEANVVNIRNVTEELDLGSLKKRFDRIWVKSHIKNITVPKKTSYKILQKAIDGEDIEELNFELREKYFDKKFGI